MKEIDGVKLRKTVGRTELKDARMLDDANPEHDLNEDETEAPSADVTATNDQYIEDEDVEIILEIQGDKN